MPNSRSKQHSNIKSTLQEEQGKLVKVEKTLLGILAVIDSAVKDLVMEEFQIKAKQVDETMAK